MSACACSCAVCRAGRHCGGDSCDESERGQAIVIFVLFLVSALGMAALVVDVGTGFLRSRQLQAAADASALACVQYGTANASALLGDNLSGAHIAVADVHANVRIVSRVLPNDSCNVTLSMHAPTTFARILGVNSIPVGREAEARSLPVSSSALAVPIAVPVADAVIGNQLTFDLKDPAHRAIVVSLNGSASPGLAQVAQWVETGGQYSAPKAAYVLLDKGTLASGSVPSALASRVGTVLLVPVYSGTGVVDFASFRLDSYRVTNRCTSAGNCQLSGQFVDQVWNGDDSPAANLVQRGARTERLTR